MTEAKKLRNYFLGWQCRIRQQAVRKADGRPSTGMQATLSLKSTSKQYGPVNTGLVKKDPTEITAEFQHIVRKTHDPNLRQQSAIKLLSSVYYQYPKEFDDCLTATFATESDLAKQLIADKSCELNFEQSGQQFDLQCEIESLAEQDSAYQTTYWHNRMFNPSMPPAVIVLKFSPDWKASAAAPAVT